MKYGQTKRISLLEAMASTAVGFGLAFAVNQTALPLLGYDIKPVENFAIVLLFTFLSIVRQYIMRRIFNHWYRKQWMMNQTIQ